MSKLANVKSGRIVRPVFILIYGKGGIGKSSWAAKAPRPIFLDIEEGTDLLDVVRYPTPRSYEEISEAIDALLNEPHEFQSLVIDSLDWVEPLIFSMICKRYGKASIELAAGGYGKGYIEAAEEWTHLIGKLSALRNQRGMNVILLGHSDIRNMTDPETQSTYQRYEVKLHKLSKAKIIEAVDAVFFACHERFASKVGDDVKFITTSKRVLQCVPNQYDGFEAKNRYGIHEAIPLSMAWHDFISHCNVTPAGILDDIRMKVAELSKRIEDDELRQRVHKASEEAWDNPDQLQKIQDRLVALTA